MVEAEAIGMVAVVEKAAFHIPGFSFQSFLKRDFTSNVRWTNVDNKILCLRGLKDSQRNCGPMKVGF